jgi:3-dehydroquinate synthase
MTVIPVKVTSKEYEVIIDSGLLASVGIKTATVCKDAEKIMLVTDDNVDKLYADKVEESLKSAGFAVTKFVFSHGEKMKNTSVYITLLNELGKANLTRTDAVCALGGGVVGDLAGFAAATYLRGVRFVQVPTTLLAMVDSSIGGKTGLNLSSGKNQVGAFYQPDLVLCDYETLETLPEEVFRDGCAEMIKHATIADAELFDMLMQPKQPQIEDIIARNITIKRDIVAQDEKDTGIRQLLNFGHTIGHGIEKHSNYTISHGSAVAIGMVIASLGACRLHLCSESCHARIAAAVKRYSLPAKTDITPEELIEAAFSDKKRTGNKITLIVPEKIGKCYLKEFSMDKLSEFIKLGMNVWT